jgi:hypothetical protein
VNAAHNCSIGLGNELPHKSSSSVGLFPVSFLLQPTTTSAQNMPVNNNNKTVLGEQTCFTRIYLFSFLRIFIFA